MAYDRPYQYLYNHKWDKASAAFRYGKLCVYCLQVGKTTSVEGKRGVTDHIIPHEGDTELFWDQSNWQPLCKHCHDSVKAREEKRGYAVGCGVDGLPLDPKHFWNKGGGIGYE